MDDIEYPAQAAHNWLQTEVKKLKNVHINRPKFDFYTLIKFSLVFVVFHEASGKNFTQTGDYK